MEGRHDRQDKFEAQVHRLPRGSALISSESDNKMEDDEVKAFDANHKRPALTCYSVCPGCTKMKCHCISPYQSKRGETSRQVGRTFSKTGDGGHDCPHGT